VEQILEKSESKVGSDLGQHDLKRGKRNTKKKRAQQ